MNIMMLGDVVGEPGLLVLEKRLSALIKKHSVDFTVINGENACGGFGLTEETLDRILAAGADAVTGGNHIWEKREFWPVLDSDKPVLRPANYPEAPGRGLLLVNKNGFSVFIINLQGRELLSPIDCPFKTFDLLEETIKTQSTDIQPIILVDFHAESIEEKEALAYYLDGRVSVIIGTHTHVQTADERILPKATAYISDLGMTGAMNGIIGMDTEICKNRAFSQVTYRMECAVPLNEEDSAIQGIIAELDDRGRAISIQRIKV